MVAQPSQVGNQPIFLLDDPLVMHAMVIALLAQPNVRVFRLPVISATTLFRMATNTHVHRTQRNVVKCLNTAKKISTRERMLFDGPSP